MPDDLFVPPESGGGISPKVKGMKRIPIKAGKEIADRYGYDQVIIVARKVGGGEHVTTYGVNVANCSVAAKIGDFFKHQLMGWPQ